MVSAILILFAIAMFVAICIAWEMRRETKLKNEFPPISDEEFLAACTPGTRPEVALRVRRIVADQLGVEYERIHPSMSFVEDFGCC